LVEKAREFERNWQIFGGSAGTSRGRGSSRGNWRCNENPRIQEIKEEDTLEVATTQQRRGRGQKRGKLTQQERQHRMANQLCLYCAKPGHIASNCPISRCPYTGISVRQLGTTPEGDLSIQTGIEDLNINAIAAFNVVLPWSGLVRSGSSPISVRESNQSGPGLDRSLTGPCSPDSADRWDCLAYLFWAWHEQPQQTMHGL